MVTQAASLPREDPMSHRIIEKRRRDRMNNCLADLSRLIPADYLKKGRGRIEKTEIIEMAIKHMKHLQAHACRHLDSCELNQPEPQPEQIVVEHYRLGYQECMSETMHFMVEVEGYFAGDPLCIQLLNHLQKHCDKILKGNRLNFPRTNFAETSSSSGSTASYNTQSNEMTGPRSSSSPGSDTCKEQQQQPPISNGSQLREILVAPQQPSCNSYNFKKNIKQRFSQEENHTTAKRKRFISEVEEVSVSTNLSEHPRRDSETCSASMSPHSPMPGPKYVPPRSPSPDISRIPSPPPLKSLTNHNYGVPIFALHSKGSFYIPLTIDSDVLLPYLATFGFDPDPQNGRMVLHPVTISVNFQATNHLRLQTKTMPTSQCSPVPPPWQNDSANYLSVPKWPICAAERS